MQDDLTAAERDVIGHSLGLSRNPTPYKNDFFVERDHPDWDTLAGLVERGLMTRRDPRPGGLPYYYFRVTEAGASAAGTHLPRD